MFLFPLGLLALLGVPAVLAIHLFRRRFRPRKVSALFLWHDDEDHAISGRRREPLRTTPSLWLELLAALLFALAFAGPRACGAGKAEHLVVVLDASASMSAELDGTSLAERARDEIDARIGELAAQGRVTIITSGARPTLLVGPAAFRAEARGALDNYAPAAPRHELAPAVALARQLAGDAEVVVVTDHWHPDRFPEEVELISVGRPGENVAISHAVRTPPRDGEPGRALITLAAFTAAPRRVEMVVRAIGEANTGPELIRRSVPLDPDGREHLAFDLPADAGAGAVEVTIESDALAIDDRVVLAAAPSRTVRIASTLELPFARALGLATGSAASTLDRLLAALSDCVEVADPAAAHLVFAREVLDAPGLWTLAFATGGGEREDLIGPFLAEKHHRFLEGLTLEGIVWSIDPDLHLAGAPLVSAGDTPILTEASSGSRHVLAINLDPARSSLPRSPDWPILLSNLVEARRDAMLGPVQSNLAIGESYVHRLAHEDAQEDIQQTVFHVRALDGDESWEVPARATLVVDGIEKPGLYAVERDGAELARFGVGFADPAESDLRAMRAGDNSRERERAQLASGLNPLQVLLLLGALVALLADWWVLAGARRRLRFDPGEPGRNRGGAA